MPVNKRELISLASSLSELWGWFPVGHLIEEARMSISGNAGLTGFEIKTLRSFSKKWNNLSIKQKEVFTKSYSDPIVSYILKNYLEGKKASIRDKKYILRKYEELFLYKTPINITKGL